SSSFLLSCNINLLVVIFLCSCNVFFLLLHHFHLHSRSSVVLSTWSRRLTEFGQFVFFQFCCSISFQYASFPFLFHSTTHRFFSPSPIRFTTSSVSRSLFVFVILFFFVISFAFSWSTPYRLLQREQLIRFATSPSALQ